MRMTTGDEHVRDRRGGLHAARVNGLPPGDGVSVSERREVHREEHRREQRVPAGVKRAGLSIDTDHSDRR